MRVALLVSLVLAVAPSCVTVTYSGNLDRQLTPEAQLYLARNRVDWVVDGRQRTLPEMAVMDLGLQPYEDFDRVTIEARSQRYLYHPYLELMTYTYGVVAWYWPAFLLPMHWSRPMEARMTRHDGTFELQTWEHYSSTEVTGFLSGVLWMLPGWEFGDPEPGELRRRIFVTQVNRLAAQSDASR